MAFHASMVIDAMESVGMMYRSFAPLRMTTNRIPVILSEAKDLYVSQANNIGSRIVSLDPQGSANVFSYLRSCYYLVKSRGFA